MMSIHGITLYLVTMLSASIPLNLKSKKQKGLPHLEIDSKGGLGTKLYDKRDDFDIPIVNFPFMSSNIPAAPAY